MFDSEDEPQMKRHAKILSDTSLIAAGYIHFFNWKRLVFSKVKNGGVALHLSSTHYLSDALPANKPRPVRHFRNYFAIIVLIRRKLLVDLLFKD